METGSVQDPTQSLHKGEDNVKCKNHRVYCKRLTLVEASLVAHVVQNLPAMQETRLRSLGQGDFSWRRVATHSQYSCLGNPVDRETWWATDHGVSKYSGGSEIPPPDTWALALLPAGLCCPPDGHKPPDSTPASHKVLIK